MRISDWSSDVCSSDLSLDRLLIDGKGRTPSGCPANPSLPDQSVKFGLRTRGRVIPFSALPEGVPQSRETNLPRGQPLGRNESLCRCSHRACLCKMAEQSSTAACWVRVCQYVMISVDAVSLTNNSQC